MHAPPPLHAGENAAVVRFVGPVIERVRRRRPVDVELPHLQRVRAEAEQVVRPTRGRRRRPVEVGREQAAERAAERHALLRRSLRGDHLRAVVRAHLRPEERRAARVEHVERRVVRVRPHAELRVVGEVRVRVRVAGVRARRVAGPRHGDALQERRRAHRELADDPAVREPVVRDRRVAVVVRLAAAAEAAPQRVRRDRPVDRRPGLVEDRQALVDDLDEVVRSDRAVRIRRRRVDAERSGRAAEPLAEPFDPEAERGRRCDAGARLDDRVRAAGLGCGRAVLRLLFLLQLPGDRRGRDVAERRRDVVVQRRALRLLAHRVGARGGLAVRVDRRRGDGQQHCERDDERDGRERPSRTFPGEPAPVSHESP